MRPHILTLVWLKTIKRFDKMLNCVWLSLCYFHFIVRNLSLLDQFLSKHLRLSTALALLIGIKNSYMCKTNGTVSNSFKYGSLPFKEKPYNVSSVIKLKLPEKVNFIFPGTVPVISKHVRVWAGFVATV